jgi:hypothetical protein
MRTKGRIVEYRTFRAATVTLTAGLLGSIIATAACDQPRTQCSTGRGDFAAKYTLVPGSVTGTGTCGELKGDTLGIQSYNAVGDKNRPDLDKTSIAIKSATLGAAIANATSLDYGDPDTAHKPYAFGTFSSVEPGSDNFCTIPTLQPAIQNIPALPGIPATPDTDAGPGDPAVDALPADSVQLNWTNVKVYVTAAATGTQLSGDLEYTENGCTAKYKVNAVFPAAPCDDGNGKPNVALCGAEANVDAGLVTGSGLNPDYAIECDPDLLLCVPAKDVPSFR